MADAQQLDVSDAVDNSGGAPPQWTRRATRADLPPDTATLKMSLKDRKVPNVGQLSDGSLAGSVLELAQTLTKNQAVLKERTEERARLARILNDFRKHLSWQAQRQQQLRRNLERLHNETQWLTTKATEVKQDTSVLEHELRSANSALAKATATRDTRQLELATVEKELKLERGAVAVVSQLCAQANKALTAHTRERDSWKQEADRAQADARKLKDRLERMAYKVNGLAVGAL